jgi:hypothetical protein
MVLQAPSALTTDTLYLVGAIASATAVIVVFLEKRFSDLRRLVYRIISAHNKEDDDRFAALRKDIHEIAVRNALRDGDPEPHLKEFRRRRYLDDENGHSGAFDG